MLNEPTVVFATAVFLENRSSVLWWENPFVWALTAAFIMGLALQNAFRR